VLLLAFAGILLAIILRTISDGLAVWMHLRAGIALGITCLLLLGAAAVSFWYIVPRLSDEGDVLKQSLPAAWQQLLTWVHRSKWAGEIADNVQNGGLSYRHTAGTILSAFSGLTSTLGGIVIVLFLA